MRSVNDKTYIDCINIIFIVSNCNLKFKMQNSLELEQPTKK